MQPGTSGTGYRFVFGVRRILVLIVEAVPNTHVGIRTSEDEWSHPRSPFAKVEGTVALSTAQEGATVTRPPHQLWPMP
jgi:hypothetical protein